MVLHRTRFELHTPKTMLVIQISVKKIYQKVSVKLSVGLELNEICMKSIFFLKEYCMMSIFGQLRKNRILTSVTLITASSELPPTPQLKKNNKRINRSVCNQPQSYRLEPDLNYIL